MFDPPNLHMPPPMTPSGLAGAIGTFLIYGGSFDPPHRAHIELPFLANRLVHADAVIFIPAGQPPHKTDRIVSPAADRLAMLRLALQKHRRTYICEYEIGRSGPSYTVDTLDFLHRSYPDVELCLLMGADMAATFYQWREPRRILELARPAVVMREPYTINALMASLPSELTDQERERWRSWIIGDWIVPKMDVSSTQLRELLRDRKYDAAEVRAAMAEDVVAYVKQRGLYAVR